MEDLEFFYYELGLAAVVYLAVKAKVKEIRDAEEERALAERREALGDGGALPGNSMPSGGWQ